MLSLGEGRGRRVLVADDERHIARLIEVNLRRQGYDVTCAYNGREAIELLERQPFDQAILDLMMPYVDGFEVLKWIRTHEETKQTWVGLMSAQADELRDDRTIEYRADDYFKKP